MAPAGVRSLPAGCALLVEGEGRPAGRRVSPGGVWVCAEDDEVRAGRRGEEFLVYVHGEFVCRLDLAVGGVGPLWRGGGW